MRQLTPTLEERRATVVLKAETDRHRLYGNAGFERSLEPKFWGATAC